MSEYSDTAKKLDVRFHIWRYGLNWLPKDPSGHTYKLFTIVRLDGWTFDPHEIVEAIANDPATRIEYQGSDLPTEDSKPSVGHEEAQG